MFNAQLDVDDCPNFVTQSSLQKTTMMGLSGVERISAIRLAVLAQYRSLTDRQDRGR